MDPLGDNPLQQCHGFLMAMHQEAKVFAAQNIKQNVLTYYTNYKILLVINELNEKRYIINK